jgi:cytochrome oxidase Cu insertion factor (SCO1/SenC/PrrC family)
MTTFRMTLLALALLLCSQARAADGAPEAKSKAWFTDTVLVTQEGKQVRFYSDVLKDRVVVISFIFTRCTTACPLIAARLNQIHARLDERLGRKVTFIAISVDPEHDTPQRLKEFARKQQVEHPGWLFLTGKKEDVNQVVARLGQYVENIEAHSTMLIAGNEKRQHWTKIRPDATPPAIAAKLRQLVDGP